MVWNNNPQNLDDMLSNYNHELTKYKSEFAKVSAEFKKDDNITVNSFMAVRPGIEELKRTRKRYARGTTLQFDKFQLRIPGYSDGYRIGYGYRAILPISFIPKVLMITLDYGEIKRTIVHDVNSKVYNIRYVDLNYRQFDEDDNRSIVNFNPNTRVFDVVTNSIHTVNSELAKGTTNIPIESFGTTRPLMALGGDMPVVTSWYATE